MSISKVFSNEHIIEHILCHVSDNLMKCLGLRLLNKPFNSVCLRIIMKNNRKVIIECVGEGSDEYKDEEEEDKKREENEVTGLYINNQRVNILDVDRYFMFLKNVANVKVEKIIGKYLWHLSLWNQKPFHNSIISKLIGSDRDRIKSFIGINDICSPGCSDCKDFSYKSQEYGPISLNQLFEIALESPTHFKKLVISDDLLACIANDCVMNESKAECLENLDFYVNRNISCDTLVIHLYEKRIVKGYMLNNGDGENDENDDVDEDVEDGEDVEDDGNGGNVENNENDDNEEDDKDDENNENDEDGENDDNEEDDEDDEDAEDDEDDEDDEDGENDDNEEDEEDEIDDEDFKLDSLLIPREVLEKMLELWNVKSIEIKLISTVHHALFFDEWSENGWFTSVKLNNPHSSVGKSSLKMKFSHMNVDLSDSVYCSTGKSNNVFGKKGYENLIANFKQILPTDNISILFSHLFDESKETAQTILDSWLNVFSYENRRNLKIDIRDFSRTKNINLQFSNNQN